MIVFALSLPVVGIAAAVKPIPCAFSKLNVYNLSTQEATLAQDFQTHVLPYFLSGVEGTFAGKRGVPIHYRKFEVPNEKGVFVISSGFTEASSKYAELIHNLTRQGYSVYILDHRGQGNSGRMVDNPARVHVDDFSHYVRDLRTFMEDVVYEKPHANVTLLGISMGGLIATLYAEKYPKSISKLALVSPMFGINARGVPDLAMRVAGSFGRILGLGREYVFGLHDMSFNELNFDKQTSTHSRARFDQKLAGWKREPHTLQGGNSFRWLERAIHGMLAARADAPNLDMPVMILQAGNDSAVRNSTHETVASRAPRARLVTFPGAWHDLLLESDEYRNPAMGQLLDFASPDYSFAR